MVAVKSSPIFRIVSWFPTCIRSCWYSRIYQWDAHTTLSGRSTCVCIPGSGFSVSPPSIRINGTLRSNVCFYYGIQGCFCSLVIRTDYSECLTSGSRNSTKNPCAAPLCRISSPKLEFPTKSFIDFNHIFWTPNFHSCLQVVFAYDVAEIVEELGHRLARH